MNKRIKKKKAKQEAERLAVEEQELIRKQKELVEFLKNGGLQEAMSNIFYLLGIAALNISKLLSKKEDNIDKTNCNKG